jgi:hypothetical protein
MNIQAITTSRVIRAYTGAHGCNGKFYTSTKDGTDSVVNHLMVTRILRTIQSAPPYMVAIVDGGSHRYLSWSTDSREYVAYLAD